MKEEAKPRRASAARRLRRRLRPYFTRPLVWFVVTLVPLLYFPYMRFVWATSRIDRGDYDELHRATEANDGMIALLWHEEVFSVAYGYGWNGIRAHTLASPGDAGEVITRLLHRSGHVAFRGGSTTSRSRRREGILGELIELVSTHRRVFLGLTVDGSRGPAYRMKSGGIVVASTCGKPVALLRLWYRRGLRLNTWDRTGIPLPFNRIRYSYRGPFFPPKDPTDRAALHAFHLRMEDELIELAAESYDALGLPRPPNLVGRTAEERALAEDEVAAEREPQADAGAEARTLSPV